MSALLELNASAKKIVKYTQIDIEIGINMNIDEDAVIHAHIDSCTHGIIPDIDKCLEEGNAIIW